jgi:very-short-patch-repair endonuclease
MANDDSAFRYWRSADPDLRTKVRELRADPTPCEITVWNAIRSRAVEDIKFRRQHPFENFVLDFYAPEINLAIEIDGDVHADPERKAYDDWRERRLAGHGVRVIRFTNADVAINLEGILERLAAIIREMRER